MAEPITSERRVAAIEKQRQALELRKAGVSFDAIAQQLGYGGKSGAYNAVKSAMQRTLQEPADELRALEVARLDALLLGLWSEAGKGNVAKIDRVLKIMERRARLLGLDAPSAINLNVEAERVAQGIVERNPEITYADALAEVERVLAEAY